MNTLEFEDILAYSEHYPLVNDLELFKELIAAIEKLPVIGGDGRREFWFNTPRCTFEEFKEEYEGERVAEEDMRDYWLFEFPDKNQWYRLIYMTYKDMHYFYLKDLVLTNNEESVWFGKHNHRPPEEDDTQSRWITFLLEKTQAVASDYEAYVKRIENELPSWHKRGIFQRGELEQLVPSVVQTEKGDLTEDDICDFKYHAQRKCPHVATMTANDYFYACGLFYEANREMRNWEGDLKYDMSLSSKDRYLRYADMRHDGLDQIDGDSVEAFVEWLKKGSQGGHPHEIVCSMSSQFSVNLYPDYKEDTGFILSLRGGRQIDMIVRAFNLMREKGIPVEVDSATILPVLEGTDIVGILREDESLFTRASYFDDYDVNYVYSLERDTLLIARDAITWLPVVKDEIRLCPVCGYDAFRVDEFHNICPMCMWQDDPIQSKDPDYWGGANNLSLSQYREKWQSERR